MNARQIKKQKDMMARNDLLYIVQIAVANTLQSSVANGDWNQVAVIIAATKKLLKGLRTVHGLRRRIYPITRFTQFIQTALEQKV